MISKKFVIYAKKGFSADDKNGVALNKKHHKVKDHCHYTGKYRGAAHDICNLRYKIPKEIPVVFHNGSTYDYHFIIKEFAEEFKGQFECFGENTKKYNLFSVPTKKKITKIDKDGNDKIVDVSYKIKFINSFRFMSSSLSSLVDNLTADEIKNIFSCECEDCNKKLDCLRFKDNNMLFKCLQCNSWNKKQFKHYLNNKFKNTYEFCNKDISKFILLLRKGIYPYEYMDSWKRFDETSLPDKEAFYSSLNMENNTDIDSRHANKVFKKLKLKNLGDYHDLCVQSDALLLADVFENFRNMCIEIYEPDSAHFLSAAGLAWQACLKETGVELELLTDVDMLLMVEEEVRGEIYHAIHRYAKANNKYMKDCKKDEEKLFLQYDDFNNFYDGQCLNHYR